MTPATDSGSEPGSEPDPRAQLEAAIDRGLGIDFTPQGSLGDHGLRRSAVLILFGTLDRLPAGHAGAAALDHVPAGLDVLLTRRSERLGHHAGQIAFPGGGAESGDSGPAATALREAQEETGLLPDGVDVLGELPEFHIPVSNNLVTPVLGWWRLPSSVAADEDESVDVFRVPVAKLLAPEARGTSVLHREGRVFRGAAFRLGPQYGEHLVWGFTGMLLSSIFDEVGWAVPWDRERVFEV